MAELLLSLGRILLLLAGVYVLLAIGGHFLAMRLLFPRPPVKYELGPDYFQLTTPDGVKLAARHWPNPQAKFTFLYLPGNYEELGRLGEYILTYVQAGYAVLAVDYRGYGHSGGKPNEANLYADAQLAYDYLRTKLGVPAERIIPFGYSLGGGPAVELALRNPVAGIILQGAFVSAYRVETRIPLFPGDKFVNLAKMPQLRCPVMVIHGSEDGTVPFWHGQKLFAAATSRKTSLFVAGGPHSGLADYTGPHYWAELKRFTDSL
jgi:abhydrolase domain-containing protein 17